VKSDFDIDAENSDVAHRWCEMKGPGWFVGDQLGKGGTAPVFEISSPDGPRALKIYDVDFSTGEKGEIEYKRIELQVALCGHDCASLVQVYDGGRFEDRLYLLMARAPGTELEKRLEDVPRHKIRHIVDQIARAALFLKSKGLCHRDIKSANVFISDDFDHATLLDISVIREIHDLLGMGTDHDGQLPVLATARYAPPEYLFRLLELGPTLWHALNVYQLGALLHDLIMKEPLFQKEYLQSTTNRYRFAWIVATVNPRISAADVDQDLVFTALRSLDKDWERRSHIRLEDFLADSVIQQAHAFRFLGLTREREAVGQENDIATRLQRVREISSSLEEAILGYLTKNSVAAKHAVLPGENDTSKVVIFDWNAETGELEPASRSIRFQVSLQLVLETGGYSFMMSAKLSTLVNGVEREVRLELPSLREELGVESALATHAESALAKLAIEITQADHAMPEM
jgi:protein kinase-like protein